MEIETKVLKEKETLTFKSDVKIEVKSGIVWVTFEGDAEDYFLRTGELMYLSAKKKPVIVALHETTIRFHQTYGSNTALLDYLQDHLL